jgi:hypothetical protein
MKFKLAKKLSLLLTLLICSFLSLISPFSVVWATGWTGTIVDSDNSIGTHASITTDSSDNILISYYDTTNGNLKFAKSTDSGSTWSTSTVDSDFDTGQFTSITTDSSDNIIISYFEATNDDLEFAKSTDGGSTWSTTTVDNAAFIEGYTSITVDSGDYLISYSSLADGLKFAKSTDGGSTWNTSTVISEMLAFAFTSITTDSSDNYLIASNNSGSDFDLKFSKSTNGGSDWSTATPDSTGDVGRYCSIATDSSDNYLISYYDDTNTSLEFVKSTDGGGSWLTPVTVDNDNNVGNYTSITTDSSNNILISYYDVTNGNLKFAKSANNGVSWSDSTLDSDDDVGKYNSITTDSLDNYLITYYDETNDDLLFQLGDNSAPSISLTAFSPDPHNDNTPSFTGTATEAIGTVSSVEYQVDSTSGTWSSCTADDGTFDEASEAFTCTVPSSSPLSDGGHTVYVRGTDDSSNTTASGSESSDSFSIDTTSPSSFLLDSPPGGLYTNQLRPTFIWKGDSTDATSGLSHYSLEVKDVKRGDNLTGYSIGSISPTTPSGDKVETDDYLLNYLNFHDGETTNDLLSLQVKDGADLNLEEGEYHWKVKLVDNVANEREEQRTLFIDLTSPKISLTQIGDKEIEAGKQNLSSSSSNSSFSTSSFSPAFYGKITDPLSGVDNDNDNKVASGPDKLEISIKKKNYLGGYTDYADPTTLEFTDTYWSNPGEKIEDNSENKSDKYTTFSFTPQKKLTRGIYQVTLTPQDKAGNKKEYTLNLNVGNVLGTTTGLGGSLEGILDSTMQTEITNIEEIPAESEEEKQRIKEQGYTVTIRTVDKESNPIPNVKVELHSDPVFKGKTGKDGVVSFTNVQPGDHTIKLSYGLLNHGKQNITLKGDNTKEFKITIQVKMNTWLTPLLLSVIGILLFLVGWLVKRKGRENTQT